MDKSRKGDEFVQKVVKLILDEACLVGNGDFVKENNVRLVDFKQPKELEESWDLTITKEGESDDYLLDLCRKVISESVKTTHPNFYNQLYGGIEEYGLAGSWLTDALNTSVATYEISPVFTIMERYMIQYCGKLIGYPSSSIDGMFCPGGSVANMYAMMLARHQKFPNSKKEGIRDIGKLVMFCSEDSHYSFVKGAIWLGHGSNSVIKVKSDDRGRIIPKELDLALEKSISDGFVPFLVAATSGTTVLGAFDDLKSVAKICQKWNIWFHVDAALGGTVLMSPKHRILMDGVEEADSVTWDLHKMACVPLQATLVLTRHKTILSDANCLNAEYLFQSDKYYDKSYDSGDKSMQCGRKVDSFKCWLMLKAYGENGMSSLVDNVFDCAKYLTDQLRIRPGFELILNSFQGNTVCFYYIPPKMRNCVPLTHQKLHLIGPEIKKRMMSSGSIMIGHQPLTHKGLPNFWRCVLSCLPKPTREDLNYILDEFERLGKDIQL